MINFKILIPFILGIFIFSCTVKTTDELSNKKAKCYKVENSSDNFFDCSEYVDSITIIPLETSSKSTLGRITSGYIGENSMYLFDYSSKRLLEFDSKGRFMQKIGKRGNGPNEYREIRDVCFTDDCVFTLDYKKIHSYSRTDRNVINSIDISNKNGFNPGQLVVYSPDNIYLWNSNPDVWNKNDGDYYRLYNIVKGKVTNKYFKYDHKTSDDQRFFKSTGDSYFVRPVDGNYTVVRLTEDSISASFTLDFGEKSIGIEEIEKLRKSEIRNAYLKSNAFKGISNIYEIGKYIYFNCVGPEAKAYEAVIDKETNEVNIGRWDYKMSPQIFYADSSYLYGFYQPHQLLREIDDMNINTCFFDLREQFENIDPSENLIIVKIKLK
jgi:hypothetical protein